MVNYSERREGKWFWNVFTFKDIVKGVSFVVLLAGSYFTIIQRISLLEYQRIQDRDDVAKLNEKVEKLYNKIDQLRGDVADVNANVKVVQSQLDNYGPTSYVYKPYKGAGPGRVTRH